MPDSPLARRIRGTRSILALYVSVSKWNHNHCILVLSYDLSYHSAHTDCTGKALGVVRVEIIELRAIRPRGVDFECAGLIAVLVEGDRARTPGADPALVSVVLLLWQESALEKFIVCSLEVSH